MPDPTPQPQEPKTLEDFLRMRADELKVDPNMALTILDIESSGRHRDAQGRLTVGDPTKWGQAQGFFQLLPSTAAAYKKNPTDPFENIEAGLMNIREAMDRDPSPEAVFRYYHGGSDPKLYGPATERYVKEGMSRLTARLQAGGAPETIYQRRREQQKPPPVTPPKSDPAAPPKPWWDRAGQVVEDIDVGIMKGLGQTAANLGRLPHLIPGVSSAVDWLYGTPGLSSHAFDEADKEVAANNTAQKVGKVGEQIGEFVIPSRAVTAAGTGLAARSARTLAPYVGKTARRLLPRVATEAAAGAGMAAAHNESPTEGALFGAAVPVAGAALARPVKYLKNSAVKKVAQAFGPTKEKYKAIIRRRTPEILKRGLSGSREGILEGAEQQVDDVGQAVDDALQAVGTKPVDTTPIITALEDAKDQFRTLVHGQPVNAPPQYVHIDDRPIRILTILQNKVRQLGPNATVAQLVQVRRVWDKTVGYAGGFAHRAGGALGLPLKEQSEEWAKREATGAIRELLSQQAPDLAAVNREFSFWKDIRDTLRQTVERTAPQGPGLGQQLVSGGMRVVGATVTPGGVGARVGGAYIAGKIASQLNTLLTSPRVRLFDARQRWRLANAIVNEDTSAILRLASQIGVNLYDPDEKSPRVGIQPPAPPQ